MRCNTTLANRWSGLRAAGPMGLLVCCGALAMVWPHMAVASDKRNGPAVEYYDTGEKRYEGTFREGQLIGQWTEYYRSGQIKATGAAAGSRFGRNSFTPSRTGPWVTYFENGNLDLEGTYRDDNLHGPAVQYFDNGQKRYEVTFAEGQLTGRWTEYYRSGQIKATGAAAGSRFGRNSFTPSRTGLWLFFDEDGLLADASSYIDGEASGPIAYSSDPDTGITRLVHKNPDGSRTVVEIDADGNIRGHRDPLAMEHEEVVAVSKDPETGEMKIVRRDADGRTTTSTARHEIDPDHTERITEVDEEGNRREMVISPDGRTVITQTASDGTQSQVTMEPDGTISHLEQEPGGGTARTTRNPWNASVVTERRDAEGNLLETVTQHPDGWIERVDPRGNLHTTYVDDSGNRTNIELDRLGNSTTTITDAYGQVLHRERERVTAMEPGRQYYEDRLGGTEWDALPESTKNRYADSEAALRRTAELQEMRELQAREEAARQAAEEAYRAQQADESRKEWEQFLAEQEEYRQAVEDQQRAAERSKARWDAQARSRELQQQYDQAVARGDREAVNRILAQQIEHDEASNAVYELTEAEQREQHRLGEVHDRLAQEINRRTRIAANPELYETEMWYDLKDSVTDKASWVFIGAEMQQQTHGSTRSADRLRITSQNRQAVIDRMLQEGEWSPEERAYLEYRLGMAREQEGGALQALRDNGRITAAGYALDAATTFTGAGLVTTVGRGGSRIITNAGRRLGSEAVASTAEAATARVSQVLATDISTPVAQAVGSAARRVIGDTAVDAASAAGARVAQVGRTDVRDLPGIVGDAIRRAPTPAPGPATGAAGSAASRALRTPTPAASGVRPATVLDNAPLRNAGARTERGKRIAEMTPTERQAHARSVMQEHLPGSGRRPSATAPGFKTVSEPVPGVAGRRPIVWQSEIDDCGVGAALTVASNRKPNLTATSPSVVQWSKRTGKGYTPGDGTSPQGMQEILEQAGLRSRHIPDLGHHFPRQGREALKKSNLNNIQRMRGQGKDVIIAVHPAHTGYQGLGAHWVTIEGLEPGPTGRILLGDPWTGRTHAMQRSDFLKHWDTQWGILEIAGP